MKSVDVFLAAVIENKTLYPGLPETEIVLDLLMFNFSVCDEPLTGEDYN